MKTTARFAFLILAVGVLNPVVYADGRFYLSEQVPARIPYQRAFLSFYKGSETLILQSKYEMLQTSSAKSLGWVVPVPSVPELKSLEPYNAKSLFNYTAFMTQPNTIRISEYILMILLFVSIVFCPFYILFFVIFLIQYISLKISKQPTSKGLAVCLRMLPLFFIALLYIFFTLPCLYRASVITDVDVVKSEEVGIYDVNVIESDSEKAILAWLNKNGFKYSDSDISVFKNYIEKKWCFVVARVKPETELIDIIDSGLVAPLVLKFKTDKAIYPMALTSVIGKDTEVLIYTLTENKQTCGSLMPLKRSTIAETESMVQRLSYNTETDFKPIFEGLPAKMNLCKFKKKLTPEKMKSDIVFEAATDNEPYQEKIVRW